MLDFIISGEMKKLILLFLLLSAFPLFAQDGVYDFHSYTLEVSGSTIKAISKDNRVLFRKVFFHPEDIVTDLDSDGVNELVVIDYTNSGSRKDYTLFIYNTLDSLYLADSIYSGSVKPYEAFSEDVNGMICVTGDTRFSELNADSSIYILPVNCWKFQDGAVYLANASVYDIFLDENDMILQTIDDYYNSEGRTCSTSSKLKAAIAGGFINYYNAGELTVANQFLKKYYLCADENTFKAMLLRIFNSQK